MKKFILLFMALALSNGMFAQTKAEKKAAKAKAEQEELVKTQALIDSGSFTFVADWANSQRGRRINMMTNPNYLNIDNETADAFLPYFGVVQTPNMSGQGGIEFSGPVKDYQSEYNDKKEKTIIRFNANDDGESFSVILTVFKNANASLMVSSSGRNSISYDGKITETEKTEEEE
jgi:hypothetical protein